MRFKTAAILAATVLYHGISARYADDDRAIEGRGGRIYGGVDPATPDVRHFLGIPYAQPPLKDLRFAPPKPALPFGEFSATRMPPSCMQYLTDKPLPTTRDVPEFNPAGLNGTTGPISEDCLTLSVWTPRDMPDPKRKLPVLVFFYGGAFQAGGTSVPYQIPAQWVQRNKNTIVVTFNHRGNIFGFPNAAGLPAQEQNVGLLDHRLALEWVSNNIHAFGGDNSTIGLFGHSSGSVAIAYYTYTYVQDPLAGSVILSSGNEYIDILSRDPGHGNFTFVASHVGCGNLAPAEELACMRRADAHAIEDFIYRYSDAGSVPPVYFSPVIDERTVFGNYTARAQEGQIARLPTLIGTSRDEGVLFEPYNPAGVDAALAEETTRASFYCPSLKAARTRLDAGIPVFRYIYSGNFSNVSPRPWMGAYHGSELPMLFGTYGLYRGASTDLEGQTSSNMQHTWREFTRTGGFGAGVLGWDPWDGTYREMVDIRRGVGMFADFGATGFFEFVSGAGVKDMDSKCG